MDLINAYQAVNRNLLKVINSVNFIEPVKAEGIKQRIRLKPNGFVLTDKAKRECQVVTAHDLKQYKNKFAVVSLKENYTSRLDVLLEIDRRS